MKKGLVITVVTALIIGIFAGCGTTKKSENGAIYNKKYNKKNMVTIKGTKENIYHSKTIKVYKENGFGLTKSDKWNKLTNKDGVDNYCNDKYTYYMMYMPEEQVKKINGIDKNKMSKDEIKKIEDTAYSSEFSAFCIYRVNASEKDSIKNEKEIKNKFSEIDKIGNIEKDNYYFAYNDKLPTEGFSDNDKQDIKKIIDTFKEVKDSIILFPPVNIEEEFKSASLKEFTTKDINGKTINQDILKKYDVTMVNVWTTWCPYCVEEMPELQQIYKKLPNNVNLITICADGDTKGDTARKELKNAKVEFTTLVKCDDIDENVLDYITGYPTTFFVNKDGKVIGHLQVGTPSDDGKDNIKGYQDLIDQAVKEAKK